MAPTRDIALSSITTWQQGRFIDGPEYKDQSDWWKRQQDQIESLLVRPGPKDNAICKAEGPLEARWIAERLNIAALVQVEIDAYRKALDRREHGDVAANRAINNIQALFGGIYKEHERYRRQRVEQQIREAVEEFRALSYERKAELRRGQRKAWVLDEMMKRYPDSSRSELNTLYDRLGY